MRAFRNKKLGGQAQLVAKGLAVLLPAFQVSLLRTSTVQKDKAGFLFLADMISEWRETGWTGSTAVGSRPVVLALLIVSVHPSGLQFRSEQHFAPCDRDKVHGGPAIVDKLGRPVRPFIAAYADDGDDDQPDEHQGLAATST